MDTSNLIGHKVGIKTDNLNEAVSGTLMGANSVGVWIGNGDAVAKVIAGVKGVPEGFAEPAVFLPYSRISWMLTETKEAVYQKSR